MATQFLAALVLIFFAVGTAAHVNLVNIGVIYSTKADIKTDATFWAMPSARNGVDVQITEVAD